MLRDFIGFVIVVGLVIQAAISTDTIVQQLSVGLAIVSFVAFAHMANKEKSRKERSFNEK